MNTELLKITTDDWKELDEICLAIDQKFNIEVGDIWHFRSHQFRRSLAVYALRSGFVSIDALQYQFKHLFTHMTYYYTNGVSTAKNLFNTQQHISNEINKLIGEISTLEYAKNIIYSEETLHGKYGQYLENNVKNKNIDFNTFLTENRNTMSKRFKNGEIAYTETALGACISMHECQARLSCTLFACIECSEAIIKKSKIDKITQIVENNIMKYDKNSIEYKTEIKYIELLKNINLKYK